jgi:hypothetical protein
VSTQTEPVFGLVTEATIDAIGAARSVFTDATLVELGRAAADAARIEVAIADLVADVVALAGVRSHEDFCRLLREWGEDLVVLAEAVLAPLVPIGVVGEQLAEALTIWVLRKQYPRLASLMSSAGVFVDSPSLGSRFDWESLRDLLLNGPGVVSEDLWNDFLDNTDADSGTIPALLAALLFAVPQAMALRTGDVRIAGLDPPPTSPNGSLPWRNLRARSDGWIPITVPLQIQGTDVQLPPSPDLTPGFSPDLAMSVLFRSQRRASGGRTVTDFEMWVHPSKDETRFELPLSGGAFVRVEPSVTLGLGYDGTAGTWNAAIAPRTGTGSPVDLATNEAVISFGKDAPGLPDLLLGSPDETRVVVRDLGLDIGLRELGEPNVELVGRAHGFALVVTNRWFRSIGFGTAVREGLRLDLDLDARYAEGTGFSIAAEGALETRWHMSTKFSVKALTLRIHSLVFRVPVRADTDHFDIRAEVRPHWSATLGPVTLVMDGAGGWVGWWAETPGDGKECVGLLPPTGVGLQLDFPGVIAGGFLDFTGGPNDRYGGVVTLTIAPPKGLRGVTVTAFGLHELAGAATDTDRDVTFIIVLGTKFRPGVAFGPGIVWNGIGGLYGHNRRADTDALRERLTSGAVGNLLFADDPIRNAPILLGDLAALFPPSPGVSVFGLTAQFGWVPLFGDYLIKAAVGVILEFNDRLTRIVVLGSLIIHLPAGPDMKQEDLDKLLNIQVDVIGDIDPVRGTVAIDATINRGRFLKVFNLTGDGGVRASFGNQRYLSATLGGFHPDFHPEPAMFPPLRRIQLSIDKSALPKGIKKLSATAYMAVTTNTLQFGAELTAEISSGNWSIEGKIGGDALIVLPFTFDVSIHGGVHVKYRGHNLIGIDFKGGLAGPSPIVLRGEVCVSLLFFDACWHDSIEIGSGEAVFGPLIATLVPILAEELDNVANLSVPGGEDLLSLVTSPEAATRPALSPLVAPTWSQNRLPLGMPIETFEDGHLEDPQRLTVTTSRPTTPQLDWFTPGAFVALSDAEEMALPSFEQHQAGVVVAADATRSVSVTRTVTVQEIRLPDTTGSGPGFTFPSHVLDRLDAVTAAVTIRPRPSRFTVRDVGLTVDAAGTVLATGVTPVQARLAARTSAGAVQHPADRLVEV